jgi:putative methionine-R-sulfoxide reductase with GAF domain
MVDKDHGYAWSKIDDGSETPTELKIPLESGLVGHSVQSKAVLNITDAYKDYRFSDKIDKETGYRTQSVVCVPIKIDGGVMAVVQAINKKDTQGKHRRFDEQDVFLLYVLGYTMTDVVIECEQHELDVQIYRRKDRLIAATGDLFLHCRSCEDLLGLLKTYLADLFASRDVALILICGDHVTRLTLDDAGVVHEIDAPKDRGLVGVAIETKRSVHVEQVTRDKTYDPSVDLPCKEGALHVWPLHRGRLLSAILEWSCPAREHVDFGDDGAFNQHNPRHADLLGKLMAIMQLYIEQWYPTTERLQSSLAQKVKTKLRATVRLSIQRRQLQGMVVRGAWKVDSNNGTIESSG